MIKNNNKQIIDVSTNLIHGCSNSTDKDNKNNGIYLNFCVYNASGPRCGTIDTLQKLAVTSCTSGAIITKSSTLINQNGNDLPRTYHTTNPHYCSFNSEGLPNNGIDYYISQSNIQQIYTNPIDGTIQKNKPYIVSLSGKTLNDNLEMIRRIFEITLNTENNDTNFIHIDSIELNVACPNIIGKPIIGYDIQQMEIVLQEVSKIYTEYSTSNPSTKLPYLGIKLPPYFDFIHYNQITTLINKYNTIIQYVVSINTVGNTLCIDPISNMKHISANNGYAGLSGPAVKYIALANIHKLRELLHPTINIIGVGGISSGRDVYEMLLCGASACQIGTIYWLEGPKCFNRIYNELISIMIEKSLTSINDIYNQIHPWSKDGSTISRQYKQQHPTSTLVKSPLLLLDESSNSTNKTKEKDTSSESTSLSTTVTFYKYLSLSLIIVIIAIVLYQK